MQKYPVRTSHRGNLAAPALKDVASHHFEGVEVEGDAVVARWGAIERIAAKAEGKALGIDLRMNPKVEESVAKETIRRYNDFLEEATGFNSKERAKRLRKSAGE